jgi:hypothetical protein
MALVAALARRDNVMLTRDRVLALGSNAATRILNPR